MRFALKVLLSCSLMVAQAAWSQALRSDHVSLIVPYPAGGPADWMARELEPLLSKALGQPVVVENAPGASGAIGVQRLLSLPADGNHVLVGSPSEVIVAPATNPMFRYHPDQLRLIGVNALAPLVLISRAQLEQATLQGLVEAQRQPGSRQLVFGSYGVGSIVHVVGEALKKQLNLDWLHVPYAGGPPMIQDMIGGRIDIAFMPLAGNLLELIATGKIRALAVASERRVDALTDVPTIDEVAGTKGFSYVLWNALLVSRQVGDAAAARLNAALAEALRDPVFKSHLEASGTIPGSPMTLDQAARLLASDALRYKQIALTAGLAKN